MPWAALGAGFSEQSAVMKNWDWLVMPPKSMVTSGSSAPTPMSPSHTSAVQDPVPYFDDVWPAQVPTTGLYSGETPQLLQVDSATAVSVEPVSMDIMNGWVAIVTAAE
jgi:hypothetical protein